MLRRSYIKSKRLYVLLSPSIHSPPSVVLMLDSVRLQDSITIALDCEKMVFDCFVLKECCDGLWPLVCQVGQYGLGVDRGGSALGGGI